MDGLQMLKDKSTPLRLMKTEELRLFILKWIDEQNISAELRLLLQSQVIVFIYLFESLKNKKGA